MALSACRQVAMSSSSEDRRVPYPLSPFIKRHCWRAKQFGSFATQLLV
jgi:hypothetical protein